MKNIDFLLEEVTTLLNVKEETVNTCAQLLTPLTAKNKKKSVPIAQGKVVAFLLKHLCTSGYISKATINIELGKEEENENKLIAEYAGVTTEELAKVIGVSHDTVNKVLNILGFKYSKDKLSHIGEDTTKGLCERYFQYSLVKSENGIIQLDSNGNELYETISKGKNKGKCRVSSNYVIVATPKLFEELKKIGYDIPVVKNLQIIDSRASSRKYYESTKTVTKSLSFKVYVKYAEFVNSEGDIECKEEVVYDQEDLENISNFIKNKQVIPNTNDEKKYEKGLLECLLMDENEIEFDIEDDFDEPSEFNMLVDYRPHNVKERKAN